MAGMQTLEAQKAALEAAKREEAEAEAALLERRKHAAELEKAIVNASAGELWEAIRDAVLSVEGGKELLSANSGMLFWDTHKDQLGEFSLSPIKRRRMGSSTKVVDGDTNFGGRRIAIRKETLEALEEQLGIDLKGQLVWDTMRQLARALGISKEDRHPDATLKKVFPRVKADLEDDAFQKSAFSTEAPTSPSAEESKEEPAPESEGEESEESEEEESESEVTA